jgi:hypothetical protein
MFVIICKFVTYLMRKENKKYILIIIALLIVVSIDIQAQCAMCKAVAEDAASEENGGVANGLNKGILYIMAIPYILIFTAGIVFFRKKIGSFLRDFNAIQ